ncbi:MAG: DUF2066 domain-containing protein [Spongiibacteraceae bacterium]
MMNWLGGIRLRGALLGVMLAWIPLADAEVVPDLYSVSVPVTEQSPAELQRAAAAGLRELAVRVSGRGSAASEPALSPAFANAMRYLEQYRYERNTGGDVPWLAQLRFAPAVVDAELRKNGMPIWGANRPALQTIIVVEDNGARAIIDEQSTLANVLREQWRRRGLILHLPRTVSGVNLDDAVRLDSAKVSANLSERGDGLLLGHIVVSNRNCDARWSLNLGAQAFNANATGAALPICVATALDRIVDNFSAQYAIAANSGNEGIVLRVTGVVGFDDYSALLNYLRRLAVVKTVQPIQIRGDEIFLQLKIAGSFDQLTRQLALESRLAATENIANGPVMAASSYRWSAVNN